MARTRSLRNVEREVYDQLQSAFDSSRIIDIFSSLFDVISDQATKIDGLEQSICKIQGTEYQKPFEIEDSRDERAREYEEPLQSSDTRFSDDTIDETRNQPNYSSRGQRISTDRQPDESNNISEVEIIEVEGSTAANRNEEFRPRDQTVIDGDSLREETRDSNAVRSIEGRRTPQTAASRDRSHEEKLPSADHSRDNKIPPSEERRSQSQVDERRDDGRRPPPYGASRADRSERTERGDKGKLDKLEQEIRQLKEQVQKLSADIAKGAKMGGGKTDGGLTMSSRLTDLFAASAAAPKLSKLQEEPPKKLNTFHATTKAGSKAVVALKDMQSKSSVEDGGGVGQVEGGDKKDKSASVPKEKGGSESARASRPPSNDGTRQSRGDKQGEVAAADDKTEERDKKGTEVDVSWAELAESEEPDFVDGTAVAATGVNGGGAARKQAESTESGEQQTFSEESNTDGREAEEAGQGAAGKGQSKPPSRPPSRPRQEDHATDSQDGATGSPEGVAELQGAVDGAEDTHSGPRSASRPGSRPGSRPDSRGEALGTTTNEQRPRSEGSTKSTVGPSGGAQSGKVEMSDEDRMKRLKALSLFKPKRQSKLPYEKRMRLMQELKIRGEFIRNSTRMQESASKTPNVDTALILGSRIQNLEDSLSKLTLLQVAQKRALEVLSERINKAFPPNLKERFGALEALSRAVEKRPGGMLQLLQDVDKALSIGTGVGADAKAALEAATEARDAVKPEILSEFVKREVAEAMKKSEEQLAAEQAEADGNSVPVMATRGYVPLGKDGTMPEAFAKALKGQLQKLGPIDDASKANAEDFQKLKKTVWEMSADVLTRSTLKELLNIEEGKIPTDTNAAKLRNIIIGVINTVGSGDISEEAEEKILRHAHVYTDVHLKRYADETAKNQEDLVKTAEKLAKEKRALDERLSAEVSEVRAKLKSMEDGIKRRVLADANAARAGGGGGGEGGEGGSGQLQALSDSLWKHADEQMKTITEMTSSLAKLQQEIDGKPSEAKVHEMAEVIESTFKRRLGENVVGLKLSVGQVLRAVQQKASKEEVQALVQSRMAAMEDAMEEAAREEMMLAGGVKCISCGHKSDPAKAGNDLRRNVGQAMAMSEAEALRRYGSTNSPNDDDRSVSTISSHNSLQSQSLNSGLRPLLRHSTPLQPRAGSQKRSNAAPEPLYRQARMAYALKEMVKGSSTTKSVNMITFGDDDSGDSYSTKGNFPPRVMTAQATLRLGTGGGSRPRGNKFTQSDPTSLAGYSAPLGVRLPLLDESVRPNSPGLNPLSPH